MPGSTAPAGFAIDEKGVKRSGSSAPSPGNTENRAAATGYGANAPLPAKGQAAGTGKTQVGTSANPSTDGSGNKSFFESRSNTARTDGAAARSTSEAASSTGSIFKN